MGNAPMSDKGKELLSDALISFYLRPRKVASLRFAQSFRLIEAFVEFQIEVSCPESNYCSERREVCWETAVALPDVFAICPRRATFIACFAFALAQCSPV